MQLGWGGVNSGIAGTVNNTYDTTLLIVVKFRTMYII